MKKDSTPEGREIDLNSDLRHRAETFVRTHAIATPGDVVTTRWGNRIRDHKVRITSVGAHLTSDWDATAKRWKLAFDLTYTAHRLRADGSTAERVPESGICLQHLVTADGREWRDRTTVDRNARWWNHSALSWRVLPAPTPEPRP